jgi:hypothetical protein
MHRLVNPAKALRTLRKGPPLLHAVLAAVTQEQALTARDGADGWSVLWIVCHMRDVEALFTQRVRDLLEQPDPVFTVVPNEELIRQGDYDRQELRAALVAYVTRREALIALLEPLTDAQWLRAGTHPLQGPATLLDVAVNAGLHDVDHLEQIVRCLALPSSTSTADR